MSINKIKVVVVGAGAVGSSVASSLLDMDLIAEIALVDINSEKSKGEALDLSHATSFAFNRNVNIRQGDYDDCEDARIIIVTAGPSAKPGESNNRLELASKNIDVVGGVFTEISKRTQEAIVILVTNPVDVITYYVQKNFDYPKHLIIGSGAVLDTARFRRIIARDYLVDTENVTGFILGEHGSSAFATWSITGIEGIPCEQLDELIGANEPFSKEAIMDEVRNVGYDIIMKKGFTNYGVAAGVRRIVQAILLNEYSILPVSTTFDGEYGISDVAMSIPCIIGANGIERTIPVPLSQDEIIKYQVCERNLKDAIEKILI